MKYLKVTVMMSGLDRWYVISEMPNSVFVTISEAYAFAGLFSRATILEVESNKTKILFI